MKRYIKPNTLAVAIDQQQLLVGSPQIDPNTKVDNPSSFDAKQNGFFTEEETAESNEYPVYSLWEE